jgi:hypothetical protein
MIIECRVLLMVPSPETDRLCRVFTTSCTPQASAGNSSISSDARVNRHFDRLKHDILGLFLIIMDV